MASLWPRDEPSSEANGFWNEGRKCWILHESGHWLLLHVEWFFWNICGYQEKGNSKTTCNSPFFTKSCSKGWGGIPLHAGCWTAVQRGRVEQEQQSKDEWGTRFSVLKVCPSEWSLPRGDALQMKQHRITRSSCPLTQRERKAPVHSSFSFQVTKSDDHRVVFSRSLCSVGGKPVTWPGPMKAKNKLWCLFLSTVWTFCSTRHVGS